MSRIFWDTHLFLYLAGDGARAGQVASFRRWMIDRGDALLTSALTLGEVLGAAGEDAQRFERAIAASATVLPFDDEAARRFARIRRDPAIGAIRTADAIQLACAAAGGTDLFVTGDDRLAGMTVPGIQFIQSLDRAAP